MLGLRGRLTIVATAVVAAGLLAGSVLLTVALRTALLTGLDADGRAQARAVAALVDQDRLPTTLPPGTTLVQVVDANQRVRATSPGADRLVPMLDVDGVRAVRAGGARDVAEGYVAQDGVLRVVGVGAGTRDAPVTVLVAAPLAQVEASTRLVRRGLVVGVPLLLVSVAGLAWALVGSVLRPVAALRRGAAEVTGSVSGRRLPVPAAQDELHRLATTLNDMLARLDASTSRQRAFVADAAHELRSPLASARTQLEVVLAHPAGADWPATATDVLTDVDRLARLVDDLLLLARADSGAVTVADEVDLAAVVAQVTAQSQARWAGRGRPGSVSGPVVRVRSAGAHVVRGDARALARVASNLLDNAVLHARASVQAEVLTEGETVVLTVDDDGPGIAPADRSRVFERFTRLDEARGRDDGGSGLGLAIVRDLVQAHGGSVQLVDATGGGLRAVVRLPAVRG